MKNGHQRQRPLPSHWAIVQCVMARQTSATPPHHRGAPGKLLAYRLIDEFTSIPSCYPPATWFLQGAQHCQHLTQVNSEYSLLHACEMTFQMLPEQRIPSQPSRNSQRNTPPFLQTKLCSSLNLNELTPLSSRCMHSFTLAQGPTLLAFSSAELIC